jgi:phospholipid transport system substrate-binding protein
MERKLLIIPVFIILLMLPVAVAAEDGPKDQTRATIDKVISILKDKELRQNSRVRERRALIRKEIGAIFDFNEMAKRALGMHWQQRSAAEKKEFVALFSDLLEKTYISKIEGYSNEKIVYEAQAVDGDYATVNTKIITAKNLEIPIVYRLLKAGNRWAVYDVIIEKVSLVGNYRTQFNQIIRTKSYEELVRRMKNKQVDDKSAEGA